MIYSLSLESFDAFRLIPLTKKPGSRLTGVVDVPRKIGAKASMMLFNNDTTHIPGAFWLNTGQDLKVEAALDALHDTFSKEDTKVVLLICAENVFNSINQKVMLRDMNFFYVHWILLISYVITMMHQQVYSFLAEVEYYLKKGQPSMTQLQWGLMPLAFYQCFTLYLTLFS